MGKFHGAIAQRRCLVPTDAIYEWKVVANGKQPYAIVRQDGQPMAFAELWEGFRWADATILHTYIIVTTDANAEITELHNRMPVILERADWPAWLGETEGDPGSLLHPSPEGILRTWPVDRRVGCSRNNDARLLEPTGDRTSSPVASAVTPTAC